MKAIVYRAYGAPDVLKLEEIARPVAADHEVLIKVRAAALNPLDWHFMRGTPGIMRLAWGLSKPKLPQLGVDMAGYVEAVGKSVTGFKPGDEVYGTGRGAFAEYACAAASTLARKPQGMTFEQAAAVPIAGLTALQALRDKGNVRPGSEVLINGAAGGVGTFAVEIAKWMGAAVTGVCSTRNVERVRELGADYVIDYTGTDFTRGGQRFTVILECVGNHSFSACKPVLNRGGIYVGIGGGGPDKPSMELLTGMLGNLVISWFSSQKMAAMRAKPNTEDLNVLSELVTSGKVTPVIDGTCALGQVAEAMRYLEQGHARGKVVVVV